MISAELNWLLTLTGAGALRLPPVGIDANRLVDLAIAHGLVLRVVPFLDALSSEAAARLRLAARGSAIGDLRHRATLEAILRAFADMGVPVVPFKGPVLADQLYPEAHVRVSNDLDILVHPEHVKAASNLLGRFDYRPQITVTDPPISPVLRLGGELLFRSQTTRTPVDLHWKLFGWSAPCPPRLTHLWGRLRPGLWRGQAILRMPSTELALYLCYHGSKHLWLQLKHLFDLARLMATEPAIDWYQLLQDANSRRESRFLLLGPYLANRLLGTPVPATLIEQCERDTSLTDVANFVIGALESPRDWERHIKNRAVRAKLLQTPRARVRYFCLEAFGPSASDWQSIRLPDALSVLYYPYRPLRLAGVRLRSLWHPEDRLHPA